MKHHLATQHKEYLGHIGVPEPHPDHLEVDPSEWAIQWANWKRTLPEATDDEVYKKTLGHFAWKWHQKNVDSSSRFPQVQKEIQDHIVRNRWETRVAYFLLMLAILFLLSRTAHCQFSKISFIQTCTNGNCTGANKVGFHAAPFTVICGSNTSCTDDGFNFTITASSTAATAFSAITAGTNTNLGSFIASGNSWDFTAATIFKLRSVAGATTSANGDFAFDSTAHIWHIWQNGADKFNIAASNLGSAGQPCLSNADGSCTFADPVVSQPTASLLNAQVVGNVASASADSGNPVKIGGVFNTTQPTVTTGQRVDSQFTARGAEIVATGVDTFHVTVDAAPTTTVTGTVTANAGTGTFTVGGTVTANQGTANTIANGWPVKLTDGTHSANVDPNGDLNIDLQQLAGSALGAPSNYGTSPGTVAVLGVNAFVTNTPSVTISGTPTVTANAGTGNFNVIGNTSTASANAHTPFFAAANTTSSTVKASAGNLYGYYIFNPNASACFLQVFNTTTPTLGTTVPIFSFGIPATGAANLPPAPTALANFGTAIAVASTTTASGASTCGTGMTVNIWFD